MRCLWDTSTFSVTKIFTPSHSWLPQQWQYPQEQQRKELRHKERYTVSNAQRITAIFTTEKLTQYSPLQYNKRHKGFIKLSVTDNRNKTFLSISHEHPRLSFPLCGTMVTVWATHCTGPCLPPYGKSPQRRLQFCRKLLWGKVLSNNTVCWESGLRQWVSH